MNKQQIINKLTFYIEDCFDIENCSLTNYSVLLDFYPEELDITLFLTEVDLDFHINLEEVFGEKLLFTPLFEIADYLEENPMN